MWKCGASLPFRRSRCANSVGATLTRVRERGGSTQTSWRKRPWRNFTSKRRFAAFHDAESTEAKMSAADPDLEGSTKIRHRGIGKLLSPYHKLCKKKVSTDQATFATFIYIKINHFNFQRF